MRGVPTVLDTSNLTFFRFDGNSYNMTSVTLYLPSAFATSFYGTISSITVGQAGSIAASATTGYVGFGAEL